MYFESKFNFQYNGVICLYPISINSKGVYSSIPPPPTPNKSKFVLPKWKKLDKSTVDCIFRLYLNTVYSRYDVHNTDTQMKATDFNWIWLRQILRSENLSLNSIINRFVFFLYSRNFETTHWLSFKLVRV